MSLGAVGDAGTVPPGRGSRVRRVWFDGRALPEPREQE